MSRASQSLNRHFKLSHLESAGARSGQNRTNSALPRLGGERRASGGCHAYAPTSVAPHALGPRRLPRGSVLCPPGAVAGRDCSAGIFAYGLKMRSPAYSPTPGAGGRRRRVVIAEDHAAMRDLIGQMLARDHDIVAMVNNGHAALAAADRLRPDLVLLDIGMPVLNGFAAARQLRRREPPVKIVFVSTHDDPLYVEEARRVGADGYVLKSLLHVELAAAVEQVLAGGSFWSGLREARPGP